MDEKVPHLAFVGWVGYFFCALFQAVILLACSR